MQSYILHWRGEDVGEKQLKTVKGSRKMLWNPATHSQAQAQAQAQTCSASVNIEQGLRTFGVFFPGLTSITQLQDTMNGKWLLNQRQKSQ